jgi:hypothetical protein
MGAEVFKAEYAAGRTLTSEQIIDLALGAWARYHSLRCTSRRSGRALTRPAIRAGIRNVGRPMGPRRLVLGHRRARPVS